MTEKLLPSRFLFRLAAPCLLQEPLWTNEGPALSEAHRLVGFEELEGRAPWAEVRAGWSTEGLRLWVHVSGKRLPVRCDIGRPTECDRFEIWVDTRDTHNVHRATRFCHQFVFLPSGGGARRDQPHAEPLTIHRAKEDARPVGRNVLKVRSEKRIDGYVLDALLPATALSGFDPAEYPRLGFNYAVCDHELGEQTFSCGHPLPFHLDPSTWGTLELVR